MRIESWRDFDFWLLGAVTILIIFSVAMINSAIAGNIELVEAGVVRNQIIFAGIGYAAIFFATYLDYHYWKTLGRILYVFVAGFLIFTLVAGQAGFGATRWINLGIIAVQPSELAKIAMIVVMADFFSRNQRRIGDLRFIIQSGILALGLVALVILQPDLSTSITLVVIWFALLFATGLKGKHVLLFAFLGVLVFVYIFSALLLPDVDFPLIEGYQLDRIVNFIAPDPEATYGEQYNIDQARITIGSGGWFGQGYGQGSQVQLRFLKVRDTDFIFASISHEFGFVGAITIMALLLFLIFRILRAAQVSGDLYGALICYGVATLYMFQAIINIGMNLNLMPVTGLPLPFLTRGGSSLVSLMLGIGLVESVVTRQKFK